jgi:TonB family protein
MFVPSRPVPFTLSLLTHAIILVWVASGPAHKKPKSMYAETIAPHASKLVWYDFRQKLPEVSPAAAPKIAQPPRAKMKIASQEIVAGSAKAPRARQFVWQPAPKLEMNKDLRSPNLLAIHTRSPQPPPKPKLFVPPPEAPKPTPQAPTLAAAPEIRTARNLSGPGNLLGIHPVKAQPRTFVAPRAGHPVDKPAPTLPDAPTLAANLTANASLPAPKAPAPPPRKSFVAPTAASPKPSPPDPSLPDSPALPTSASASAVSVAIVGLDPKPNAPAPAPEGSRDAQFSAGPQPRSTGGTDGSSPGALLSVPGLLVHNGTTDTKPTLMARVAPTDASSLRAAMHSTTLPAAPATSPHATAMRVSSAPDSPLNGRVTYQMSIQMPNVTSYTGSWMIWFAERQTESAPGGALSAPLPVRKVDPKYYQAAVADRVEGTVRLTAVIRKDGTVDSITLLQHLDDRLDQSAQEAMDKWRFEPALRDGQPVDVDAVIEIPFRLAPKIPK